MVEADEGSGARWTVYHALEQDREVFCVPGSIFSPASRFTNRMIQEGAKLASSHTDILEELNLTVVTRQAELPLYQESEVTDEMALFTSGPNINFYHPLSGAFVRSFAAVAGTVEGLAWDGQYLWQLETNLIYATSIVDGSVFFTLPNAAGGAPFGGTGIANSGPNTLTLAGADGNWWTVSKTDGSVINSGNNGLAMYGLAFVPSPGAIGLIGVAGLIGRRRRRRR